MVIGADDFGRQPKFTRGHGNQSQIRTKFSMRRKPDFRTGRHQTCASEMGDAGSNRVMQAPADYFVPRPRRVSSDDCPFKNLLVGSTHGFVRTVRKYRPVWELRFSTICSGVPWATIFPPASPPS